MKKISLTGRSRQQGFTLVEIIMVILVAGILGVLMYQYFGTSFLQSALPLHRLNTAMGLKQIMENITEAYQQNPSDLATLKTNVQDGRYGACAVLYNNYVLFSGQTLVPDNTGADDMLKVTIRGSSGATLTALFVSS